MPGRRLSGHLLLSGHLDSGRRDGDRDEYDGAQAGQHLAVHCISLPGSVAVVEHLRIARLVAGAGRQEAAPLLAALFGGRGLFGSGESVGTAVCGQQRGQIGKLLGLKRKELVSGLRCLKRAGGPWLWPTSADISARLVSMLLTTPACTRMAS